MIIAFFQILSLTLMIQVNDYKSMDSSHFFKTNQFYHLIHSHLDIEGGTAKRSIPIPKQTIHKKPVDPVFRWPFLKVTLDVFNEYLSRALIRYIPAQIWIEHEKQSFLPFIHISLFVPVKQVAVKSDKTFLEQPSNNHNFKHSKITITTR